MQTRDKVIGYMAGIAAGVTYGMNPLFGKPLLAGGMPVSSMLFFRYLLSMLTIAVSTRLIGPVKTSVLGVFEPITAIMTGTLAFAERLTPLMAAGIILCLAAILFMVTERK